MDGLKHSICPDLYKKNFNMKIKRHSTRVNRKTVLERWGVRVVAILTAFMGGINLVSAIIPALKERMRFLEQILPLEVSVGSRLATALAAFALLILANSLWRRKRTAWLTTVIILVLSIVTHLLKGIDYEEASLGLMLLILMLVLRSSFHAASDPPSIRQGLYILAVGLVFTMLYGTFGFFLLEKHFNINFNLLTAIRQTWLMFVSFNNPSLLPAKAYSKYFLDSIYAVGLMTMGTALFMLIRPVLVRMPSTNEEWERAKTIVEKYGRNFLARPVLFNDKQYYFSQGGSVIAYAVHNRGVLVLGDPIGPRSDAYRAIKSFEDYCRWNDWLVGYASVSSDYLKHYHRAGYETICIGYEAIVQLSTFTLEGGANKDIRSPYTKINRLGYQAIYYPPPLDDRLLRKLGHISDAWLTQRHGGEMRFSDGWFDDNYIRNSPVMVVHDPKGRPIAFVNFDPEYQKNELSVDLMRHYHPLENGTMEFLFVSMLEWAKLNGYDSFSLGVSSIVGVGEKPDDPRVEKALHTVAEYVKRFYNFRGLHTFKDKFHPQWEPRYIAYPGVASLPLVLSTLLWAHSGDNYIWRFIKQ
jgi:phosphatidylglycerol lysyltransferase